MLSVCPLFSGRPLPSQPGLGRVSDSQLLSPPIQRSVAINQDAVASMGAEFTSLPFSPTYHGGSESEEDIPPLLEGRYTLSELGLEDEAPPLPERLYTWSDVEDNDEEVG